MYIMKVNILGKDFKVFEKAQPVDRRSQLEQAQPYQLVESLAFRQVINADLVPRTGSGLFNARNDKAAEINRTTLSMNFENEEQLKSWLIDELIKEESK